METILILIVTILTVYQSIILTIDNFSATKKSKQRREKKAKEFTEAVELLEKTKDVLIEKIENYSK